MQNQIEEKYSRAELIKQARDSFSRHNDHGAGQKKSSMPKETTEFQVALRLKSFIIRLVICVILFLAVLTVDQMSLSYHDWKSSSIQELIATNQTVDSIKKNATEFTTEKIIPVFNGLW